MAQDQDNAQRTEPPTQKRLDDARKKGDAPKSQEVTTLFLLAAMALGLWAFGDGLSASLARLGRPFLEQPHAIAMDASGLASLFSYLALAIGATLGGIALIVLTAALAGNMVQAKPVFTTSRMAPKLSKLSPVAGAKRIFGPSGLVNFAKGLAKIVIVGMILGLGLWPDREKLPGLLYSDAGAVLDLAKASILKLVSLACLAMTVIAGLDMAWQRHSWRERLKMTREEVRRELKETEGDPQIKGRQRQLRDAQSRQRMLVAVQDATVLIMNPTHYAVALKYAPDEEAAPNCVAKGLDELALRLRAEADRCGVPVVENPPLARALHGSVDVGDEIPVEHFEAVAKVIGFVMSRGRKNKGDSPER
ncbi:MAG: flagellar biosynthesis protein FlhB [Pseudomonadota bacterium]